MYSAKKIGSLIKKTGEIKELALATEQAHKDLVSDTHPGHKESARNLLHYLAVRTFDLNELQSDLSDMAISSISHSESHIFDNLQKVSYLLGALAGNKKAEDIYAAPDAHAGAKILNHNSRALFGKVSFNGQTKVMATLPTEAGDEYDMVCNLIRAGMQVARINTAHDTEAVWGNMMYNIKKAEKATGNKVKIYMDLEGPKIRTGAIKSVAQKSEGVKEKAPFILLNKGERMKLLKDAVEGHGGAEPEVSVTLPEVIDSVKCGERVWFDDGKMGGKVNAVADGYLVVEITQAPDEGFKLKAEKGINFPDSNLDINALTEEDIQHLSFIAKHADMVGFSFIQRAEDIQTLRGHLKKLDREDMGIILKIETRFAFEHLPALLFSVMQSQHCGIMIARGDLAVEIGYSRMAEVQEEILWLAEAAHMPVIWATQVLETQVKKGIATRAEISDVVKAVRAECVMLNKGPYIIDAIETLKDIDKRMAGHEDKKRKILRSLHVAKAFLGV
jgi:pyruvate kinase